MAAGRFAKVVHRISTAFPLGHRSLHREVEDEISNEELRKGILPSMPYEGPSTGSFGGAS